MKKITLLILSILILPLFPISAAAYGWGYEKNKDGSPPDVGFYGPLLEQHDGFYIDKSGDKEIYITFDNGYEEGYTGQILDILKEKRVPAAFFITGHYINSAPELVKRMNKEGHIIGNHSWHHPDFTSSSKSRIKEELDKVETAVAQLTDQKDMLYLRPPRGTFTAKSLELTRELGYINAFWSIAFVDWNTGQQKGWKYAYDSLMSQVHPGAVMLLHSVSEDNALALEKIIDDLRAQGYTFHSLDHLMMKKLLPRGGYWY
ncbi:delta-lactam-biosynthetic de-N-acetylase [Thalassobacillus devorans]|uniref:Delta-lactam-biosynthetic de-N-acetylase n=1 Tax=Thalassobacillus devorans TaxID=279813 RepID=A0ABQ1PQM1_9BACI|nr:delta-lactam-biosynthetic de-N-acetylase [Thalassobacillus devorans]NIK30621.1 peptidoglycan-N-acetylmuramic acid deacetylase [Thalassobacillus devorans]GGD01470.1 delta-lactam-biosynthetic de-N-acetylase [Thalassobacillus devorans]